MVEKQKTVRSGKRKQPIESMDLKFHFGKPVVVGFVRPLRTWAPWKASN